MTDLTIPDPTDITENVAKILGIPTDFLEYFAANKTHIKDFLNDLRGDMGAMAELKLLQLIASGDAATIRWALPRLMPKQYNLVSQSSQPPSMENVTVVYGSSDE